MLSAVWSNLSVIWSILSAIWSNLSAIWSNLSAIWTDLSVIWISSFSILPANELTSLAQAPCAPIPLETPTALSRHGARVAEPRKPLSKRTLGESDHFEREAHKARMHKGLKCPQV